MLGGNLGSLLYGDVSVMLLLKLLRELVSYLLDFAEKSGSEMESDLTLSRKSTRLRYHLPCIIHVKTGQYTKEIY